MLFRALFIFVSLFITSYAVADETLVTAEVTEIVDGDTIFVSIGGEQRIIRLAAIDADELTQPFGSISKEYLTKLIEGKVVEIRLVNRGKRDRSGHYIAYVFLGGTEVNQLMVSHGMAWVHRPYSGDRGLLRLEDVAKENQVGLWANENPIAPWVWRVMSDHF